MLETKEEKKAKAGIGVIVGRFHVPVLSEGHKELIESVIERHDAVMIILGLAPVKATKNNPLDYETRRIMIQTQYPNIKVMYLNDNPSNVDWVKGLDRLIETNTPPESKVTLYGSRESFLEVYKTNNGKNAFKILEPNKIVSGTRIRECVATEVKGSDDFRRGVIWATQNQYDKMFVTVDIAPFKLDESGKIERVLFASKKEDQGKLRFIGGFTQPGIEGIPKGKVFEYNARRETREEAGIELGELTYLGSFHISDWRYRSEKDKITTTLFTGEVISGNPEPMDDIDSLEWVSVNELSSSAWHDKSTHVYGFMHRVAELHRPLVESFIGFVIEYNRGVTK